MQTRSIIAGAAFALVAGLDTASAAEKFSIIDGVTVTPMYDSELLVTTAGRTLLTVCPGGAACRFIINFPNEATLGDAFSQVVGSNHMVVGCGGAPQAGISC